LVCPTTRATSRFCLRSTPLDEQVTLRHSGDFAARPDLYEFEWRYAPPQDGRAPATYSHALTNRLGSLWLQVDAPAAALPSAADYASAPTITVPRSAVIRPTGSTTAGVTLPGLVLRTPYVFDLSSGVPAELIFSADIADLTGFVLYVNGVAALAHQAPAGFTSTAAASGLIPSGGLPKQFRVDRTSSARDPIASRSHSIPAPTRASRLASISACTRRRRPISSPPSARRG
jgi:hypothetical protein